MQSILIGLIDLFQKAALKAYPELSSLPAGAQTEITQSTSEKFGHYQYNSAMKLSKALKQNPRSISETIITHLESNSMISHLEIAGPGFVNITINPEYITKNVDSLLRDPHLDIPLAHPAQKIIIDFSSPNVAKEMHVGHLRSTIIGDCLSRVFEFLGHDVVRLSHIGDWGTAFGMLIAHIQDETPEILTGQQHTDLTHLVQWYKASKKRFDEDPVFKKRAQLQVVKLQQGDSDSRKAWEIICQISREAYQEIYDLLDVRLIERGESFYNPMLSNILEDLEKKGMVEISDGAKCIFLEGFKNREGENLPLMLQKSDGGYNYATTDMAAIYQRIFDEKAERLIYITDAGQSTHFQMIFQTAEKAGYLNSEKIKVDHIPFGLVLGPDGKKFRTRSGETERLIDLLTTAIDKADQILQERNSNMNEEERKKLASALGIGAIKYADLSSHRSSDYAFSYDRMLRFEGNTAAFLMYAYVRVAGIKRFLNVDVQTIMENNHISLEHPAEIDLGLQLLRFQEAINLVVQELLPHRLTDYLYHLTDKFNAFFRDCRVEGTPQQNSRLLLCEATARVLKQGLTLLGVSVVERM